MLKMSTELRAGTSWYSSLFFILLYYKGKTVLFSVFLPCLINFSSYLCKQHLYCKPMYHSSVSKKSLIFVTDTHLKLDPITEILFHLKIWQPNAVHHCFLDHHGNKFDGCTSSSDSGVQRRGVFFRRWDSKDGVRGKKEEDERAALMNFVPTEMAFLRPEVSQKDLVSCFLVLVFDSCSGFWKLIVS